MSTHKAYPMYCPSHSLVVFPDNSVDETVAAGSTDPELQPYDPWGRGGAGAPVYDSKGNPAPNVYGRIQQEVMAAVTCPASPSHVTDL